MSAIVRQRSINMRSPLDLTKGNTRISVAELFPIAAIDRSGALVRGDGTVVRALGIVPISPHALGTDITTLTHTLEIGESLQFYVEAAWAPEDSLQLDVSTYVLMPCYMRRAHAMHASLLRAEAVLTDLNALGLQARHLDGPELAGLLARRINPTVAPPSRTRHIEVLGALDDNDAADEATGAAAELLERLGASIIDLSQARHVHVNDDLEQIAFVAGEVKDPEPGWLLGVLPQQCPSVISAHVHRSEEGFEVAIYCAVRELGPDAEVVNLAEAIDDLAFAVSAATGVSVDRGEFRQAALWSSTLPLADDRAGLTTPYGGASLTNALPIVGVGRGSSAGLPLVRSRADRKLLRVDPWDSAHGSASILVCGEQGSDAELVIDALAIRGREQGYIAAVIDPSGRHGHLHELVPDEVHETVGASAHLNPWDTPDHRRLGNGRITFLLDIHELLLGGDRALDSSSREALRDAIFAVLRRCAADGRVALERDLHSELEAEARQASARGARALTHRLGALVEDLEPFVGDAPYAPWLDRPTRLPGPAACLELDLSAAPAPVRPALMLTAAEHAGAWIERSCSDDLDGGLLAIDGAEHLLGSRAGISWLAAAAASARRRGVFLAAVTSDVAVLGDAQATAVLRLFTSRLLLRQPHDELATARQALGLLDSEVELIAGLSETENGAPEAYWDNGPRGRSVVSLAVRR